MPIKLQFKCQYEKYIFVYPIERSKVVGVMWHCVTI